MSWDNQNVSQNLKITQTFLPDQIIILSKQMVRKNKLNTKSKQRIIILTNHHLYSFKLNCLLDSKVVYSNLLSISVNKANNSELVVNVAHQNDYHLNSYVREKIIQILVQSYFNVHKQKMPIYYYEDQQLFNRTVKGFVNKNIKTHKIQPIYVSLQTLRGHNLQMKNINQKYDLLTVIGIGASSKIMLGRNKANGKCYAIKIISKQTIIDKEAFKRVKAQRQILQAAKNPFLVSLHFASQAMEHVYFVMDFIQGGDLHTYLSKMKKLSEGQILIALTCLHQYGFIYRDLKLQNILLERDGYIKLADFDLCKRLMPEELTYSIVGTPQYVSPQIIKGSGASFATDWWAFGLLIYELTYGRTPFYSANHDAMFSNILNQQVTFDPAKANPSIECQDLIKDLLKKDKDQRIGGKDGGEQIKSHPWFADINWDQILQKKIVPEFIPTIKDQTDISNFTQDFTKQQPIIQLGKIDVLLAIKFQQYFEGFDYNVQEEVEEKNIEQLQEKKQEQNQEINEQNSQQKQQEKAEQAEEKEQVKAEVVQENNVSESGSAQQKVEQNNLSECGNGQLEVEKCNAQAQNKMENESQIPKGEDQ